MDPLFAKVIQGSDPSAATDTSILDALNYIIWDEPLDYIENTVHTLSTSVPNNLCGDPSSASALVFSAEVEGSAINTVLDEFKGDFMSFDPTTRTFRVDSDDEDLIDEVKTYKMRVELADYPTATYPTASFLEYESTVTFQDPSLVGDVCENPNIASITTET